MKNMTYGIYLRNPLISAARAISTSALLPLLMLSSLLTFSQFAAADTQVKTGVHEQTAIAGDPAARHLAYSTVFNDAVANDLNGNPQAARQGYDLLLGTEFAGQVATPSAINLAVLNRFDESKTAFRHLADGKNTQEAQYASLWQLWLTARTWTGSSAALQKQLTKDTAKYHFTYPRYQAIARLYAGKGSPDAIFSAVKSMPETSPLAKGDAVTEATFFTGGYLQYVAHNNNAAQKLYEREKNALNRTSLEKPLIDKATATLLATNHKL